MFIILTLKYHNFLNISHAIFKCTIYKVVILIYTIYSKTSNLSPTEGKGVLMDVNTILILSYFLVNILVKS